jgi:hypothetical protein
MISPGNDFTLSETYLTICQLAELCVECCGVVPMFDFAAAIITLSLCCIYNPSKKYHPHDVIKEYNCRKVNNKQNPFEFVAYSW